MRFCYRLCRISHAPAWLTVVGLRRRHSRHMGHPPHSVVTTKDHQKPACVCRDGTGVPSASTKGNVVCSRDYRNLVPMSAMMLASIAKCSRDYPNLVPMSAMMLASIARCSRDYPKFTPFGRKSNRILFKISQRHEEIISFCDCAILL